MSAGALRRRAFPPNWGARATALGLTAYAIYALGQLDITWARLVIGLGEAGRFLAFSRRLLSFCFLERFFCAFLSRFNRFFNGFGALIFSPVSNVAKVAIPKSIPTACSLSDKVTVDQQQYHRYYSLKHISLDQARTNLLGLQSAYWNHTS